MRSAWDAIVNRVPGANTSLEPKRNVLGEPIDGLLAQTPAAWVNPVTLSREKNDKVFNELASFNRAIQPPSTVYMGKIDLLDDSLKDDKGRTAYDLWQERIGQVKHNGKTLRQALEHLIQSSAYKKLPTADVTGIYDSPRVSAVKSVIYGYRQLAMQDLQKSHAPMKEAANAYYQDRMTIVRGHAARNLERFLEETR
jgi:hypothetical protein